LKEEEVKISSSFLPDRTGKRAYDRNSFGKGAE
jgi:hypothetical protein